jgi:hypothetical protein
VGINSKIGYFDEGFEDIAFDELWISISVGFAIFHQF